MGVKTPGSEELDAETGNLRKTTPDPNVWFDLNWYNFLLSQAESLDLNPEAQHSGGTGATGEKKLTQAAEYLLSRKENRKKALIKQEALLKKKIQESKTEFATYRS